MGISAPYNTCFVGATRVHTPNGISIGSAAFAKITTECRYTFKCSSVAEMGNRLATADMGWKLGGCAPLGRGSWVPIQHNVAEAESYQIAKFHLDPSNRLVTVHQRHRQTDKQTGETGETDNGPIA